MANQSKLLLAEHFKTIVMNVLLGSRKNRAISASIVAIVGFLIYMRNNSKGTTENLKLQGGKEKVNFWGYVGGERKCRFGVH